MTPHCASPVSHDDERHECAPRSSLAIDGGPPVRDAPLPGPYPGACLIDGQEEEQVLQVLRSKSLFRFYGPGLLRKAEACEQEIASRMAAQNALLVNSGTSALKCALYAAGVARGDEVLVPAYSYVATADVVLTLGAKPVFVEVDDSLTMDPDDIERKITERTTAITPVHLFGVAADMEGILALAKRYRLRVVEDCAQSFGARFGGRHVGSWGDAGITSFQLNKVITAGEGGAIWSNDEGLFDRAVRLHDHGNFRSAGASVTLVGEGLRMSELSAAVLLAQLGKLNTILARLRTAKGYLIGRLKGIPGLQLARIPDSEGDGAAAVLASVRSPELCEQVVAAMNAEGIRVLRQYGGLPLYLQPEMVAAHVGYAGLCPITEALVARTLFLGLSSDFTRRDLDDVIAAFGKVLHALA